MRKCDTLENREYIHMSEIMYIPSYFENERYISSLAAPSKTFSIAIFYRSRDLTFPSLRECLYFKNRQNRSSSRGSCLGVINDYQSAVPTWILSRMGVRRVEVRSLQWARGETDRMKRRKGGREERKRGDGERERVDGVWSFANMNVLSVTAAPCQERTAC